MASYNHPRDPSWYLRQTLLVLVILALLLISGCDQIDLSHAFDSKPASPELLVPKILATWPHDQSSFTEGLAWHDGHLLESSGLYGRSNIREVNPKSGSVLERKDDPSQVFGEGLAPDEDQLYQLTWREHTGYIYDINSFAQIGTFSYTGEGWGLCFDGQHFLMSDGTATITIRDPKTFTVVGSIQVLQDNNPITRLNELECVGDSIYANVWMTNTILRINEATGAVTGVIDASGLLTPQELVKAGPDGVLNGIAYDEVDGAFFITGKLWPKLFEVEFVPRSQK